MEEENNNNSEDTSNANAASTASSSSSGEKVDFVESTAADKGDASPFPMGSGLVAPANTPVAPMFGKGKSESGSQKVQHEVSKDEGEAELTKKSKVIAEEEEGDAEDDNADENDEEEENDGEEDAAEDDEEDGTINKETSALLKEPKDEIDKALEEYAKERLALEEKYQSLLGEAYKQRNAISQSIKGFWLQTITSIKPIGVYILQMDDGPLEYLTDIRVALTENGYTIDFDFDENPFFENKTLTKALEVSNLFGPGSPVFGNFSGTVINWKSEENNLCARKEREGDFEFESFFHYFNTTTSLLSISNGEVSPPSEEQQLSIKRDQEISEAIRTRAIPNAVKWYSGELVEKEEDEDVGASE